MPLMPLILYAALQSWLPWALRMGGCHHPLLTTQVLTTFDVTHALSNPFMPAELVALGSSHNECKQAAYQTPNVKECYGADG